MREHKDLPLRSIEELAAFRAEAVLTGPSSELPHDVFAPE
jgi:hypothetical protein